VTAGPFHAIGDMGMALRDIAAVISHGLGLPLLSLSAEEAAEHFGWFAPFLATDAPADSRHTQAILGWSPQHWSLLADLADPGYFRLEPAGAFH
jgi:hypothetical protein